MSEVETLKIVVEMIQWSDHNTYKLALQNLLELYNKEKEQNRVNINSINNLMKECNEENKRCMELAIELNEEKEKNKELENYMKEYLIPKSTINLLYISKDKIKEKNRRIRGTRKMVHRT